MTVQRLPSLDGLVSETMRTVAAVHGAAEGQRLSGSFTVGLESAGHLPVSKVRYTIHPESRIPAIPLSHRRPVPFSSTQGVKAVGNVRTLVMYKF